MKFDIAIIGGGPGGTKSAQILGKAGKSVALISDELGGECLNYGCIPTKIYLASAELLERVKADASGFTATNPQIDWEALKSYRVKVVDKLRKKLEWSILQAGVQIFRGRGNLNADGKTISINGESITADKIIIATGSDPREAPALAGVPNVLTNREIISIQNIPSSLLIIGGGIIGVEFASFFAEFGTKVAIAERSTGILPRADHEIAKELTRIFARKKISILSNTEVTPELCGTFERVLMAIGRKPIRENDTLQKIGIKFTDSSIETNSYMQTSVPHIYAIGDVAGKAFLAYTADREGEIAALHILGKKPEPIDYNSIASTIFSLPEIASTGPTENELIKQGIEYIVGKANYSANSKALIMGSRDGFAKILVDKKTKCILAIHIIGTKATELIGECSLAVTHKMTLAQLRQNLHGHPVQSEIIKDACDDVHFSDMK